MKKPITIVVTALIALVVGYLKSPLFDPVKGDWGVSLMFACVIGVVGYLVIVLDE